MGLRKLSPGETAALVDGAQEMHGDLDWEEVLAQESGGTRNSISMKTRCRPKNLTLLALFSSWSRSFFFSASDQSCRDSYAFRVISTSGTQDLTMPYVNA